MSKRVQAEQDCADAPRTLAELLTYIAEQAPRRSGVGALQEGAHGAASGVDPALIDYFRDVWSSLGTRRMLRQSQAQVPTNAGPLNSQNLVHRSLTMMRSVSPGYLAHFLSYADALSWMEQLSDERSASKAAVHGARARKTRT